VKIYISGPITGIPDGNRRAFSMASMQLDIAGHESVSPHNNGLPADASWQEHMRADIRILMDCEGMALLPGWRQSKGAQIERDLALSVGIVVKPLEEWLP